MAFDQRYVLVRPHLPPAPAPTLAISSSAVQILALAAAQRAAVSTYVESSGHSPRGAPLAHVTVSGDALPIFHSLESRSPHVIGGDNGGNGGVGGSGLGGGRGGHGGGRGAVSASAQQTMRDLVWKRDQKALLALLQGARERRGADRAAFQAVMPQAGAPKRGGAGQPLAADRLPRAPRRAAAPVRGATGGRRKGFRFRDG